MQKTVAVLLAVMIAASPGYAQNKLGNGQVCGTDIPDINAAVQAGGKCMSGRCAIGPANSGEVNVKWYCKSADADCALPGSDGAKFNAQTIIAGSTYICRRGGSMPPNATCVDVCGPSRFAP
jgi:hypothetical protein